MRLKVYFKIDPVINIKNTIELSSSKLNQILGVNNKWHDMDRKPYTCSLILGGKHIGKELMFDDGRGYMYINTEDNDVVDAIINNSDGFDIVNVKIYSGYNLLSAHNVKYNINSKPQAITEENKSDFIKYVKNKYCVDIEILKMSKRVVHYKNNCTQDTTDLLIRCNNSKNVSNLFETGIGGCCSIGYGFVEPINKK